MDRLDYLIKSTLKCLWHFNFPMHLVFVKLFKKPVMAI